MNKQTIVDKSDAVLILCVVLITGCWLISISNLHRGVTLDDGWIHLTFARNLAQKHIWSINPAEKTGGASSLLWVLILAVGFLFTSNGVAISYSYNIFLLVILALLIRRFVAEFFPQSRKPWSLLASIIVISTGNIVWFAFTGMETLLLLTIGLAGIYFASKGKFILAGIFVLLSSLTRPEGIIIALVLAILLRKKRKPAAAMIGSGLLGLAIVCLWNFHLTGTILPSTLIGRRWIIGAPPSAEFNPIHIAYNFLRIAGIWGFRLMQFTFGVELLKSLKLTDWLAWSIAISCAIVSLIGFIRYASKMKFLARGLLLWSVFVIFAYAVMMPTRGHAGRYQPMIIPFVMICFVLGIGYLWQLKTIRIILIALTAGSICSLYLWCEITRMSLVHFERVHISAARWIAQNTPLQAKIAAFDIGALGYFGNRQIIDLGGLIDPQAGRAMYDGTIVRYMHQKQADYLSMIYPYTYPNIYMTELKINQLEKNKQLQLLKTFHIDIEKPYWPGDAARLLTNTIKVYKIKWKTDRR